MDLVLLVIIAATAVASFMGFQNGSLFERYKFNVNAILHKKEYVRLISSGFLHADWMHLIFNMLTLFYFGPIVVRAFGAVGFFLVYFGSIVAGNLFSLYLYKHQGWYSAIGASGGVSGVLFAAIAVFPHLELFLFFIPIPIKGYIFGALYFGYSVYMMLNPKPYDHIGHAAHLGGALFGLLYAVGLLPLVVYGNAAYLLIMALPLFYLGYEIFVRKRL
ncbi:rhomboid family intramembrane serine protease [Bergeyella sp. RCAD1439]|uniref:rhomboid family intramembrane serine protease n=1 Tax=Bergeyella anatis TaxID=3113737 RepID=UPI002E1852FF|nr:rhomboid family intramembrane serine protease [Bergeyella sp. RCAD1439]